MKYSKLTEFQCQTHNPLLMFRGCNPIPTDAETPSRLLPFYKKFHTLYNNALRQTESKNLVFGLEVSYSDVDQGLGGFYNGGYVPINLFSDLRKDFEKDFNFYWPRDPFSHDGKFMRFIGAINLGPWPRIFHDMISFDNKNYLAKRKISYIINYESLRIRFIFSNQDTWMYLFASSQNEFDSVNSDCCIQISTQLPNFDSMTESQKKLSVSGFFKNKDWTEDEIKQHIIDWQNNKTVIGEYMSAPKKFFCNIRPRFYFDGIKRTKKIDDMAEGEIGIMKYGGGDCSVYGAPRSQQEAKRYISPDSYNGIRACTPMFCFNDAEHDMTHQFYADTLMIDPYHNQQAYCKLDSSCT